MLEIPLCKTALSGQLHEGSNVYLAHAELWTSNLSPGPVPHSTCGASLEEGAIWKVICGLHLASLPRQDPRLVPKLLFDKAGVSFADLKNV